MAVELQALVDSAPSGIAVVDREHRYLFANPALETVLGISPSAAIGKTNDDLLPPLDAARLRAAIDHVFATQQVREIEFAFDRRHLATRVSPLGDDQVCLTTRDVTVVLAAEHARNRTRRLQLLTAALLAASDPQQVLAILVDAGRGALGAEAGVAWTLRDTQTIEVSAVAHDGPTPSIDPNGALDPSAPLPICEAIRTLQPLLFTSKEELGSRFPAVAPTSFSAWAVVPLSANGVGIGAVEFAFIAERPFSDEDRELLMAMAGQASLAYERARLHAAHLQSEDQLRHALQAARAAIWTMDLETAHVDRDPSFNALLGSAQRTATADFMLIHPDDRDIARAAYERALRDRVAYEPTVRIRRADGTYIWVQGHGRVIYDTAGEPVRMAGVMIDVDEAKRASLRAEEERRINETMLRVASSFATELDHDKLVQRIIDELRRVIGAESGRFVPDATCDDSELSGSHLELALVTPGGDVLGHLHFRHHDPNQFTENHQRLAASVATQAAIALENARLYRAERVHKEALERAVERAHLADRRKDEFLAMLGHELRNPLAPILTALELIDLKEIAGVRKERDVIRRQVTHLSRLLDDLLDVSRITRGKVQLDKRTVELSTVLGKAIEMASPLLERRFQHLDILGATDILVDADEIRLAQVFQNLLTNASKYSEPRSRIVLQTAAAGEEISVSVRDHGIGIAPELLPRLFELFVQGERALDRAEGGLGIGLTIARSLCELHNGTIQVASDGVGTGSTFTVRLPRSLRPRVSTEAIKPLQHQRGKLAVARVLVVDDNVDAALMLREVLAEMGHDLRVAHDGPSALEVAATFKPDIAVLDIGLPVMSGYELARRLREQLGDKQLRLIAVTGYGQEADRAQARAVGFDHHLIKPIELDALLALLER